MNDPETIRSSTARRPLRWLLITGIGAAMLSACISADGVVAPPDCEEPPVVPIDTVQFPDSVRPPAPTNPSPDPSTCSPPNS